MLYNTPSTYEFYNVYVNEVFTLIYIFSSSVSGKREGPIMSRPTPPGAEAEEFLDSCK